MNVDMQNYKIAFQAQTLNESALQEHLEGVGATEIRIRRTPVATGVPGVHNMTLPIPQPEGEPLSTRDAIRHVASFGQPFGTFEVVEKFPHLDRSQVAQSTASMIRDGMLKRVSHGIYARPDVDPSAHPVRVEIVRNQGLGGDYRDQALLAFLSEARTSQELIDHLGVTRQRVHQKLQKLLAEQVIMRQKIGPNWYFAKQKDAFSRRKKELKQVLSKVSEDILACLPEKGTVRIPPIADHLGLTASGIRPHVDALAERGLVDIQKIAHGIYVALTPKGRRHQLREAASQQLEPSDLRSDFGALRADIMHIVDLMQPILAREIRYALLKIDPDYEDHLIPQRLSNMRTEGLLAFSEDSEELSEHRPYVIGPDAEAVMGWLKKYVKRPSRSAITKGIEKGYAAHSEKLSRAKQASLTERQLGLLQILADHNGSALSTPDITDASPDYDRNTIHLAIRGLETRGLVRRAKRKSKVNMWSLTPDGRTRLLEKAGDAR